MRPKAIASSRVEPVATPDEHTIAQREVDSDWPKKARSRGTRTARRSRRDSEATHSCRSYGQKGTMWSRYAAGP